jgi:Asp-tRNA(Asn)/Glu-tRNA(Gln) amidotransferase A subunit family amidase
LARELVDIYLGRIADRAPRLQCIATLTADQARAEATVLDRESAAGKPGAAPWPALWPEGPDRHRRDTHGLGAEPYRDRVPAHDATIVQRLREAGAVLIAKTTCGALAYGDIWYGGRTRNPWNIEEGSSGSSAGSAAAVADGLCSFAIGTETMGSIIAPAARCGTVGLRPTFGHVPRTGAMALCWSLDKIGVLARDTIDTHAVLSAIHGHDGEDPCAVDQRVSPLPAIDPATVTIGYRPEWFDGPPDRRALEAARRAGFRLVEIDLPATDIALLGDRRAGIRRRVPRTDRRRQGRHARLAG